jgi:6-phosphofructokinase 1
MNAAIRAVTRTAIFRGWRVLGVRNGYAGLIAGSFMPLEARDVGGIVGRGGTMLGSARCPEFREADVRARGLRELRMADVDGLVVIGGNGSQSGAAALSAMGYPVVGVASTIDNDLYGSEITLGVDTALNIALEAIDRLRVTAASHQRAFLVEVMGRDCGYLALLDVMSVVEYGLVIP